MVTAFPDGFDVVLFVVFAGCVEGLLVLALALLLALPVLVLAGVLVLLFIVAVLFVDALVVLPGIAVLASGVAETPDPVVDDVSLVVVCRVLPHEAASKTIPAPIINLNIFIIGVFMCYSV
jgi:hypothetical protein